MSCIRLGVLRMRKDEINMPAIVNFDILAIISLLWVEDDFLLPGWPVEDQIHGTGNCSAVQPSIGIYSECLAGKLLKMTWLLNGLEKTV